MASWTNYKIDVLQRGQPRPYADSIYQARITATRNNWSAKPDAPPELPARLTREEAILLFQMGCESSAHERAPEDTGWETLFTEIREEAPGVWLLTAMSPYTG